MRFNVRGYECLTRHGILFNQGYLDPYIVDKEVFVSPRLELKTQTLLYVNLLAQVSLNLVWNRL